MADSCPQIAGKTDTIQQLRLPASSRGSSPAAIETTWLVPEKDLDMGKLYAKSAVLSLAFAAAAFAADPFIGVWNVNPANSKNTDPSADPARVQGMKLIYEGAGPDSYHIARQQPGDPRKMLARMDGKGHSNDSDGRAFNKDSTLPAGTGIFTIAWQRIDDRHQLLIFKKNGKEYSRRETSVSMDGRVLTLRQWGFGRSDGKPFDYTLVFDKE